MRALVISPQPFFSYRGTPFSVYYRTLITAELGIQVDLLTYGEGENVNIPGVRIIRIPRFKFLGKVKVGPSLLKLFLDCFIFLWCIGLLVKNRYAFVQAHEEAVFICCFLKPIFNFKLIYDMHSSLAEQLSNFKFTQSKLLINLFKSIERTSLKAAEATIVICPSLYHYAQGVLGKESPIFLIENSIFEEINTTHKDVRIKDLDPMKFIESLSGKRYVAYAGTLEPYQGIDIVIRSFQVVLRYDPTITLLIIGGTKAQIRNYTLLAEEYGIKQNCMFVGQTSLSVAKYYLDRAAVQISSRISGTNTPLKVYEQLTRNVPIVATNVDAHTQVLNDQVAFLVEPDPADMARGIWAALTPDGEGRNKAENAQKLYRQKYARKIYKDKLKQALESLNIGALSMVPPELNG